MLSNSPARVTHGVMRLLLCGLLAAGCVPVVAQPSTDLVEHGEYIFHAAGCVSCHTRDQLMAGGRAVTTPFGTFYPPNATPQAEHGIGAWSEEDFIRALREGMSPRGEHYYPAFPYGSYTRMSRQDMQALYAYLMTLPESSSDVPSHELHWPFSIRPLMGYWKARRFSPGAYQADPSRSQHWNRGAYLAEALGHCGECHTPRDALGAPRHDRYLAGTCAGPEDRPVANITPDAATGIGDWSFTQLADFLRTGRRPDGSFTGAVMAEVLGTSTMRLTEDDLHALVMFLQSVPPISNDLERRCGALDDAHVYE